MMRNLIAISLVLLIALGFGLASAELAKNETATVIFGHQAGIVPDIININDNATTRGIWTIVSEPGIEFDYRDTNDSYNLGLWNIPDSEFTNSTDVIFVEYNTTEGYASFYVLGGFESYRYKVADSWFTGGENFWPNALVKGADGQWEARQLYF